VVVEIDFDVDAASEEGRERPLDFDLCLLSPIFSSFCKFCLVKRERFGIESSTSDPSEASGFRLREESCSV